MKRLKTFVFFILPLLLSALLACADNKIEGDLSTSRNVVYNFAEKLPGARTVWAASYIDFGDKKYQPLLLSGWFEPESYKDKSWVWAVSQVAKVEMLLSKKESKARELAIRCMPFLLNKKEIQNIDLFINGKKIHTISLKPGFNTYSIPLAKGSLIKGRNVFSFCFSHLQSPYLLTKETTFKRPVAVAFDYLQIGEKGYSDENISKKISSPDGKNILQPLDSEAVFNLIVPENAVMQFSINFESPSKKIPNIRAEVRLRCENEAEKTIFATKKIKPNRLIKIDLSKYAGKNVEIGLLASRNNLKSSKEDKIIWTNPQLLGNFRQINNVILIVVDTLRADHLSCYGGKTQTPNIDTLAKAGTLFKNAYSHIPITGPSHTSIFTSLLPPQHWVHNNAQILKDDNGETLPKILQKNYLETAGFVSLGILNREYGFDRGFDKYYDEFPQEWFKDAGEINALVLPWLNKNYLRPFFLFVHYSDPHEPYSPPGLKYPEIEIRFEGEKVKKFTANGKMQTFSLTLQPGINWLKFISVEHANKNFHFEGWMTSDKNIEIEDITNQSWKSPKFTLSKRVKITNTNAFPLTVRFGVYLKEELSIEEIRERYALEVKFVDKEIGRLFQTLKDLNLWGNSLIVFTSDHGEGLGEHNLIGHIYQLYNSLLSVPLIMSFPGKIPSGNTIYATASHIDILPTILELLEIKSPEKLKGISLVPLLKGEKVTQKPVAAFTYKPEASEDLKGVILRGYKYITSEQNGKEELYFLKDDPQELKNIISENPEIAEEAKRILKNVTSYKSIGKPKAAKKTEETIRKLRSLGYIN